MVRVAWVNTLITVNVDIDTGTRVQSRVHGIPAYFLEGLSRKTELLTGTGYWCDHMLLWPTKCDLLSEKLISRRAQTVMNSKDFIRCAKFTGGRDVFRFRSSFTGNYYEEPMFLLSDLRIILVGTFRTNLMWNIFSNISMHSARSTFHMFQRNKWNNITPINYVSC